MGVELVERTGRNPQNLFIQLGCSKMAEHKMLHYVRAQCIGKPFSNFAMVRSLVWPRETDHTSFFCAGVVHACTTCIAHCALEMRTRCPPPPFVPPLLTRRRCARACAELVASVLKVGGLLDSNCNPGAATPEMLHRIYAPRAAVAANPVLLRELNAGGGASTSAGLSNGFIGNLTQGERMAEREALLPAYMRPGAVSHATGIPMAPSQPVFHPARRRAASPPRGHFQAVNRDYAPLGASRAGGGTNACSARCVATGGLQLTMDSLRMGGGSVGGLGGLGGIVGGVSRCKVHPR